VLTLVVLLVLSALAVSLLALGTTESAVSANWRDHHRAFYGAEAGVESGVLNLRLLLAATPSPTTAQLDAIAAPTLPAHLGLSFTTYSVQQTATAYSTVIPVGQPYAGFNGVATDYQVTAAVNGPGGTRATVSQVIHHVQIPLFQFGVFYGRGVDLEIAPGANMTFNGRVHANSNIHVGTQATLSFDGTITTAGHVYRWLKRDPATIPFGDDPRIKDSGGTYRDLNFDYERNVGFGSTWTASDWKNQAQSTFGPSGTESTVKDSTMGAAEIVPPIPELFYNPSNPDTVSHQLIERPNPGDSAELAAAKLYSKAGLRIIDGSATDGNGYPVSLPAGAVTTKTFYDKREQKTMTVTEVNVGILNSCTCVTSGFNGVLYVADTAGQSTQDRAVRLVNGATLPASGLSVVSENPVYVQGDYNTVNKRAAAVLADAITVLSNNWGPNNSDTKGSQNTDQRPATPTTVNAAFATGPSAESTSGNGNGQLENVIRFLEDWRGDTFTYKGSIVALWHSTQATGQWRNTGNSGSSYYYAPSRVWGYDTMFNTQIPPGTPMGVIMLKGRWARA
jgi:hypothetical protein